MEEKKVTISAKEPVADTKSGLDHDSLKAKYCVSDKNLEILLDKLIAARLIEKTEAPTKTAVTPRLLKPKINYPHVLYELSVNSKYPCEVIRELISNSYDASATELRYYPLLQHDLQGFAFFDNGTGMSDTDDANGISPCTL